MPLITAWAELRLSGQEVGGVGLAGPQNLGKWFIFYAMGIRLFYKGIRQASRPGFTELGFANMTLGTMGILSVINDQWRLMAVICGVMYFGLAVLASLMKRPVTPREMVKIMYNLFVLIGLIFYLISL